MRATNHVLTGALIGATISEPLIARPLALVSHFALDALPHYGGKDQTTRQFFNLLLIDATLSSIFLLFIIVKRPNNWPLILACAVLAASPDLMWFPRYVKELRLGHPIKKPMNAVNRWHKNIQWAEKPYFWWAELIWAIAMLALLVIPGKI